MDDILISGGSPEEHFVILEEVFRRLQEHNTRLNPARCIFFQSGLEFLGHWIDKNGIRPFPQKMDAVMQAKSPTNVTELKSYLGLRNCYGKFLPNLATTLHPLHDLLQKDKSSTWTEAYNRTFVKSKKQLQDSPLLVHYNLKKSLRLACDASPYGVGAVFSHVMENGEEKPNAFSSRTLTDSECNYSQIERGLIHRVWSENVPFVSVWSEVHIAYRSSAAGHNSWAEGWCPSTGRSKNAKVVFDLSSLSV